MCFYSSYTLRRSNMEGYSLISSGQCPLLNARSHAKLNYDILHDDKQNIYLRFVSNSGGGFFSPDIIALTAIKDVLQKLPTEKVFSSTVFNCLFVGKSANNASFLAAVLRQEGMLCPSSKHVYRHQIGNLDAICKNHAVVPNKTTS